MKACADETWGSLVRRISFSTQIYNEYLQRNRHLSKTDTSSRRTTDIFNVEKGLKKQRIHRLEIFLHYIIPY